MCQSVHVVLNHEINVTILALLKKISAHVHLNKNCVCEWNLKISPRSALIHSQREWQLCMDSLDIETKWEWKIRNYSVKLNFSTTCRGMVGGKKEREERRFLMLSFL